MAWVAINVPRRTNLLTAPEDLSDGAWTKTRATIDVNTGTAPDGGSGADELVSTAAVGSHYAAQNLSLVAGKTYTFSIHGKFVAGFTAINLQIDENNGNSGACGNFTFSSQTFGSSSQTGSGVFVGRGFAAMPNDWFRLWLSYRAASSVTGRCVVYGVGGANVITDKVRLWGSLCVPYPNISQYPPL